MLFYSLASCRVIKLILRLDFVSNKGVGTLENYLARMTGVGHSTRLVGWSVAAIQLVTADLVDSTRLLGTVGSGARAEDHYQTC